MEKQVLDFIVIGAQKCGTTSLFEYLSKHPELYLPPGKGGNYFSNDAKYAQDWTEFLHKHLPYADPALKWGSVSAMYMYGDADLRKVPLRIRERLPDVRLIAILRDPVKRARSHHLMAIYEGWETRSFEEVVEELLQPDALETSRREIHETTGYVTFGEYGRILAGYLDVFPREQLLVLFTSQLEADPPAVLRNIFEFIGVDPNYVPDNLGVRYLEGSATRRIPWLNLSRWQAAMSSSPVLRSAWHGLPAPARLRVDTQFNRLHLRVRLWNRRGGHSRTESSISDRDREIDRMLTEHFKADAALLTDLVGVKPPWVT